MARRCGRRPQGIDGYFENVGGVTLDAVLQRMNAFGRIAVCGMIAGYNGAPIPLMQPQLILVSRLLVQGFIVSEHMDVWPQALAEIGALVAAGKLKYRESVAEGLAGSARGVHRPAGRPEFRQAAGEAHLMRAAATVLLLRELAGELEVLMMRRGAGLAFMAGMWVFPGGRIDAADASAAARARRARGAGFVLRSTALLQGERSPTQTRLHCTSPPAGKPSGGGRVAGAGPRGLALLA
jgi:hypothetical protein